MSGVGRFWKALAVGGSARPSSAQHESFSVGLRSNINWEKQDERRKRDQGFMEWWKLKKDGGHQV